jgi:fucose 4-O-acetylase-like acetyltransferase
MSKRELYIDHLRVVMTAMVVFAHAAITYGGTGNWFYVEVHQPAARSSILLSLFVITCNTGLMAAFFLLAGYFTPGSLERKGYGRFLLDRMLRLGVPLLLFGVFVAPLTIALSARAAGYGFRGTLMGTLRSMEFHTGPMWFAEDLLLFSLGYCVVHALRRGKTRRMQTLEAARLPRPWQWMVWALAVGVVALLIRQVFPVDARVAGIWPAALPLYVFLFAVGVAAWRNGWLGKLEWRTAWSSVVVSCVAWPVLPVAAAIFAREGRDASSVRGFGGANIALAFWEPLVAFGLIAALLLLFRRYSNEPGAVWDWLGRRAYAVYFIHPLTLVAVCMMLRHVGLPALVKFAVAGVLGCVASWLAGDVLVRLPGLRRIL